MLAPSEFSFVLSIGQSVAALCTLVCTGPHPPMAMSKCIILPEAAVATLRIHVEFLTLTGMSKKHESAAGPLSLAALGFSQHARQD